MYYIVKKRLKNRFISFFLLPLGILFLSGCSLTPLSTPTSFELSQKIERLTHMLEELDITIEQKEAQNLAQSAIFLSRKLVKKYELVSPPLWHNTLINMGIKKRGLCYDWAEDLLAFLNKKQYRSLKLHYVGADIDGYFEHNALAVSAKGKGIEDSIILDAWRDSGNLFFIRLKEDKKYKWRSREDVYRLVFPHLKRWSRD